MPFRPDKRLQRLYDKYNSLWFDGKLPRIEVGWDDLPETERTADLAQTLSAHSDDGSSEVYRIAMSNKLRDWTWDYLKMVLLHECAHVAVHPYLAHGKKFQNEMRRLAMLGAMDGLW